MTPELLKEQLNSGRFNKARTMELAEGLSHRPELTAPLLQEVFAQDAIGDSFSASWVFDHLMRKNLDLLLPHLKGFVEGTAKLKTESCMRAMAHVMELLNAAYFKERDPNYTKAITSKLQEQMVTICFDWLIGEHKVATKAFAMSSLFYLGEKYNWVWPELASILKFQIAGETAGFKNRGGKILKKLKNMGY